MERTATETAPRATPDEPGPGDARGLALRLGTASPGSPGSPAVPATPPAAGTPAEAAAWLARRRDEVIARQEWPVVAEAWRLASAGRARDLVALDALWGRHAGPCEASLRVGRRQLARLRPLRDARVVQRYLDAVEAGDATGWHPVVYGVWLAVFGVPLRQGLVQYAEQALGAWVDALPPSPALTDAARDALHRDAVRELPARLAELLPAAPAALPATA